MDVIFGYVVIADQDLAGSLAYRRYDHHFGIGEHSRHGDAVCPENLRWIFRDQVADH